MSAARHDPSSRTRWFQKQSPSQDHLKVSRDPFEKQSVQPDNSKPVSSTFKFNTFASVIGIKSKKLPSLTIQSPTLPTPSTSIAVDGHPKLPRYTNRPPANSVSSTIGSWDDPIEPLTPSDVSRSRASFPRPLLTHSPPDAFPALGGIVDASSVADPNRLSTFSNLSLGDGSHRKESPLVFNRSSMTSTSSTTQQDVNVVADIHSSSFFASARTEERQSWPVKFMQNDSREAKRSWNVRHEPHSYVGDRLVPPMSSGKNGSSSTVTLTNQSVKHVKDEVDAPGNQSFTRGARVSEIDARQQTTGISRAVRSSYTSSSSSRSALSAPPVTMRTRTISRRTSHPRIAAPPPPTHDLPPPPASADEDKQCNESESSSSLSFVSSNLSALDVPPEEFYQAPYQSYNGRHDAPVDGFATIRRQKADSLQSDVAHLFPKPPMAIPMSTSPTMTALHHLKKAVSHQSLNKRNSEASTSSALVLAGEEHRLGDKAPRKQRSFHHPRFSAPLKPSIPHISVPLTPPRSDASHSTDQRNGHAAAPVTVRKRLFSGSSIRRSSTNGGAEDDVKSFVSFPFDVEPKKFGSSTKSVSPIDTVSIPSFLDCDVEIPPSSPTEYIPRHIISPAEMLKIEATVETEFESKYSNILRGRARGASLASSTTSASFSTHLVDTKVANGVSTTRSSVPARSTSVIVPRGQPVAVSQPVRPSSSSTTCMPQTPLVDSSTSSTTSSSSPLSPGSRARHMRSVHVAYDEGTSSQRSSIVPIIPLSPPPPRKRVAPSATPAKKKTQERYIIRKPSFLDIADGMMLPTHPSSFLDLDDVLDTCSNSVDQDVDV